MKGYRFNPKGRFSDRVEKYVKYRPGYPAEIADLLKNKVGLRPGHVVADIGSGTGILTEVLLGCGVQVYAVEPNDEMRTAAESKLSGFDAFHSICGSSEATGLKGHSVDSITAAQAFHWFEPEATRREFERILRPGCPVVLIWNDRQTDGPLASEYEDLIVRHSIDYNKIDHRNVSSSEAISEFYGEVPHRATLENNQMLDFEGLKGRLLSSSYIPDESHPTYKAMIKELRDLFDRHHQGGMVRIEYNTEVFWHSLV